MSFISGMNRPEVLVPAGGAAMLIAAVRSGADAVYLGGHSFNARMKAEGFDAQELREAVRYCHEHFVRVCYTFNTLLFDDELDAARRALRDAYDAGVDAVIVQDLAAVSLMRELGLDLPIHASTQMTVHNIDGARAARDLGFTRVVLAREMSTDEIALVISGADIETEVFVHGAHCMSVSGQCQLSAMIGGRSGNRGECAQPCRLPFARTSQSSNVPGEGDHALSLRDLSLLEHIDELTMLGVTSLKIEGRLKRPEYVAASVSELRRVLDGGQPDMKLLESVFSRSGFTDGYFTGRRDRSMFGVRTKENVVSAKDVLKEIALTVNTEPAKWPLDMKFAMHAGETASLTVSTVNGDVTGTSRSQTDIRIAASELMSEPGISVTVTGPVPETALTAELTEERLRAQMAKLGGTPYFLNDFTAELDAGLMLRSSDLNNMRRAAVSRIAEKRIEFFEQNVKMPSFSRKSDVLGQLSRETLTIHQNTPPIYVKNANSSRTESHTADHQLRIRIQRTTQLTPFLREQATFVIAPLKTALELADGFMHEYPGKLIAELPAVAFDDNTGQIMNLIELLPGQGVQHFSAGNLYAIEMLRKAASRLQGYSPQGSFTEAGILLHGDSGLNITNSRSLQACLDMGLTDVTISPELGKQRIIKLDGLEYAGILAYGYLPLMQLRNCPAGPCPVKNPKQGFLAASCSLTDRFGKKFPVDCTDGISTLHNCVPLYIGDKQAAFLDRPLFYTLYFTSETSKKCELITRSFLNEDRLSGELTGGLYFR